MKKISQILIIFLLLHCVTPPEETVPIEPVPEPKIIKELEEDKSAKEAESAFKFFVEKFGENDMLDLRNDENKALLSEAYFNQYDNPTVNKHNFKDQFEYNKKKPILSQIKKKKYLFIRGEEMSLSDYDFKGLFYKITWIKATLPFPKYRLQFRYVTINDFDSWGIGGFYEINNEMKFQIKADLAEKFYTEFKSGNWNIYAVLQVLKTKDMNAGIKCKDLRNTLFNGSNGYDDNYHVRPTCISERWEKLIVRSLETKLVGYYLIAGGEVYKGISK